MGPDFYHHKFRYPQLGCVLRNEVYELFNGPELSTAAIFGNCVPCDGNLVLKLRSIRAFIQQTSNEILPPAGVPLGLFADLLYRLLALPLARGCMDILLRGGAKALYIWTDCVAELIDLISKNALGQKVKDIFIQELTIDGFKPITSSVIATSTRDNNNLENNNDGTSSTTASHYPDVAPTSTTVLFSKLRYVLTAIIEHEQQISKEASNENEVSTFEEHEIGKTKRDRVSLSRLAEKWLPINVPGQPPAQLIRCLFALLLRCVPHHQYQAVLPSAIDLLTVLVYELPLTTTKSFSNDNNNNSVCSSRILEAGLAAGRLVEHLRGLKALLMKDIHVTDSSFERRLQRILRNLAEHIKRDTIAKSIRDLIANNNNLSEGLRRVEALRRRQFEILSALVEWHLAQRQKLQEDFLEFLFFFCKQQQSSQYTSESILTTISQNRKIPQHSSDLSATSCLKCFSVGIFGTQNTEAAYMTPVSLTSSWNSVKDQIHYTNDIHKSAVHLMIQFLTKLTASSSSSWLPIPAEILVEPHSFISAVFETHSAFFIEGLSWYFALSHKNTEQKKDDKILSEPDIISTFVETASWLAHRSTETDTLVFLLSRCTLLNHNQCDVKLTNALFEIATICFTTTPISTSPANTDKRLLLFTILLSIIEKKNLETSQIEGLVRLGSSLLGFIQNTLARLATINHGSFFSINLDLRFSIRLLLALCNLTESLPENQKPSSCCKSFLDGIIRLAEAFQNTLKVLAANEDQHLVEILLLLFITEGIIPFLANALEHLLKVCDDFGKKEFKLSFSSPLATRQSSSSQYSPSNLCFSTPDPVFVMSYLFDKLIRQSTFNAFSSACLPFLLPSSLFAQFSSKVTHAQLRGLLHILLLDLLLQGEMAALRHCPLPPLDERTQTWKDAFVATSRLPVYSNCTYGLTMHNNDTDLYITEVCRNANLSLYPRHRQFGLSSLPNSSPHRHPEDATSLQTGVITPASSFTKTHSLSSLLSLPPKEPSFGVTVNTAVPYSLADPHWGTMYQMYLDPIGSTGEFGNDYINYPCQYCNRYKNAGVVVDPSIKTTIQSSSSYCGSSSNTQSFTPLTHHISTLLKNALSSGDTSNANIFQETAAKYWLPLFENVCPRCLVEVISIPMVGKKLVLKKPAISDNTSNNNNNNSFEKQYHIIRRFLQFPEMFQLLLTLMGLDPFNPIFRDGQQITFVPSSETLAKLQEPLLFLTTSFFQKEQFIPDGTCTGDRTRRSHTTASLNSSNHMIFAEYIAYLLAAHSPQTLLHSNVRCFIQLIRHAISEDLDPDPLLLPFGMYLPCKTTTLLDCEDYYCHPLTYLPELNNNELETVKKLRGRTLLLHMLEPFETCLALLGISIQQLQQRCGSLDGYYTLESSVNLPYLVVTEIATTARSNIFTNKHNDKSPGDISTVAALAPTPVSTISNTQQHQQLFSTNGLQSIVVNFTFQLQTLPQSCLYPSDIQPPAIFTARLLVDRLRILFTLPLTNVPDILRVAGTLNITPASFDELFSDAQLFSEAIAKLDSPSYNALLDPLGQGIRIAQAAVPRHSSEEFQDTVLTSNENIQPPMSWIPPTFMQGYLFRGLTSIGISSILVHIEGIIRRVLAPGITTLNKEPGDVILGVLLEACTGAARVLGLSSFPYLLALLDTRPLLALIASPTTTDPKELLQHLRLILWWYGLLDCKQPSDSRLWDILEEHLARVTYHPLGRRITHNIAKVVGPLIPEDCRGLFIVANCGTWLSHAAPRLSFPSIWNPDTPLNPVKLQEAWGFITRHLRQSGSVAKRLPLDGDTAPSSSSASSGVAKIIEDDVEKSEKTLQQSGEVLLLLREIWDYTLMEDIMCHNVGANRNLDSLIDRILTIRRSLAQNTNTLNNNDADDSIMMRDGCLPKERFLQLMEMIRCLWTMPNHHISPLHEDDNDDDNNNDDDDKDNTIPLAKAFLADSIAAKAFRATEPLSAALPIASGYKSSYGASKRTLLLHSCCRGKPNEQRCLAWRLCKTAYIYLKLLSRGVIYEAGETNPVALERHVALIFTLLASLSEATAHICPLGMFWNWDLLTSHVSPAALYPFVPAIVLRIVQLRISIIKTSSVDASIIKILDESLYRITSQMRALENDGSFGFSHFHLSVFCEVLLRFSLFSSSGKPEGPPVVKTTETIFSRCGKQADDIIERLSSGLLKGAGIALSSEELSTESKSACLEALLISFKELKFISIVEFQQKAKGTAEQSAKLIQSCLRLTTSYAEGLRSHQQISSPTVSSSYAAKWAARRAGEVLGLCGAPQPFQFRQELLFGDILNQTGTHHDHHHSNTLHPPSSLARHPDFPWWDSCSHFLALRAVEQLFYPNIHNRLSLFCCQELLKYLDRAEHDTTMAPVCHHHDHPGATICIADLLSDQTKSLAASLKSSSYVVTGTLRRSSDDVLQRLAEELMNALPPSESNVFQKSGLQLSSHLPEILQFLFPRLLLTSLASASHSSSDSDPADVVAFELTRIFEKATEAMTSAQGHDQIKAFSLYGPARTCQALDMLQALLHVYLNSDGHTLPTLQERSKTDLYLRQCLSLSLSRGTWTSIQRFLQAATSRPAAIAATKCGAYSRSLFYLESTYASRIPWWNLDGESHWTLMPYNGTTTPAHQQQQHHEDQQQSMQLETKDEKEQEQEERLVDAFVNAFQGLENWDDIRGSYRALPKPRAYPTEQVALELQSQGKLRGAALEYFRLAKALSNRAHEFASKGLRTLLNAGAYGDFLLFYADASNSVKAACLPLLQRVLWHSARWKELECVTQLFESIWDKRTNDYLHKFNLDKQLNKLSHWDKQAFLSDKKLQQIFPLLSDSTATIDYQKLHHAEISSAFQLPLLSDEETTEMRYFCHQQQLSPSNQCYKNTFSAKRKSLNNAFIPSLGLPSLIDVFRFALLWNPSDIAASLSSGVLAALHSHCFNVAKQRVELFHILATNALAATAGESYARSYAGLVPLQLATDLRQIINRNDLTASQKCDVYLKRVDLLIQSPAILWDMLTTFKVTMEELEDIPGASAFAYRLSKLLRKSLRPTDSLDIRLPGTLQLSDILTLAENNPLLTTSQLYELRIELAKSLPLERRMETLKPICNVSDKAAAMHGTLKAELHHLFSEKLYILQQVVEKHPHSEKAHRCLAEIIDDQIHQVLQRTTISERSSARDNGKQHLRREPDIGNPLADLPHLPRGWCLMSLVESSIHHHLEAAGWAVKTRRVRGHLLRFLQMLLDVFFNDVSICVPTKVRSTAASSSNTSNIQDTFVKRVCPLIQGKLERIPASHWYLSVAQLVARSQHSQLGPLVFQPLLARLLQYSPAQMAWQLGPLFCSERKDRREVAAQILSAARNLRNNNTTLRPHYWKLEGYIERTVTFASTLITLATNPFLAAHNTNSTSKDAQNNPPKDKISIAEDFPELLRVLRQSGSAKGTTTAPARILMPLLSQLDLSMDETTMNDDSKVPWVVNVGDSVIVMRSKQRPKRLTLLGSDGHEYFYLVKRESRGDLRKDTRLMEISGYFNNWIERVEKATQKELKVRRYSVIPLNEVTGLIEWLPNLTTLRAAVLDTWENEMGQARFMILMKKVIARYNRHKGNPSSLENDYNSTLQVFQPVLQKFFFNRFGRCIPVWYYCRKRFTESLASWSILGFILGLGDRHGENVLLDMGTGQIVHVDFDCLFGKGLHLPVPEIVPFRLTPNLVTAVGFGGLYGSFLSACTETMSTLRQYRGDCLSVLQSFVFDPSIEWTRTGKNLGHGQTPEDDYVGGGARARQLISEIEEKLNGGINFRSQRSIQKTGDNDNLTLDEIYHHVTLWVTEDNMDVQSQVEELIRAAHCPKNLSLMYVGWMPWL